MKIKRTSTTVSDVSKVWEPKGMLLLDTSPRLKVGKLFLPKRVSEGEKEYIL